MSEETSPIVVTLKGGVGYDAPWLVIRGNRPDEVANMLTNLGNLPEVIAQQASLFAGTVSAGPVLAQPEQPQQAPPAQAAWGTVTPQGFQPAQQPQAAPQWAGQPQQQAPAQPGVEWHPTDTCQLCGGGVQKKVINRKSDNKTFKFWTCVNQRSKGDGHYSEFAN